ncbi:MAG: hypothetical protein EA350_14395 [Gemmatimonadales bacterium]|nr:MAG: hypothetical protein EA350_14395 [Gemmatimonadales bacterium]
MSLELKGAERRGGVPTEVVSGPRSRRVVRGLCLLTLAVAACTPDTADPAPAAREGGETLHPDAAAYASAEATVPVHDVRLDHETRASAASPGLTALEEFENGVVIGVYEGPEKLMLGEIAAAVPLADGSVAVLDPSFSRVRVFSAQGEPAGFFGEPGEGPGGLEWPTGLSTDGASRVLVADMGGRRLEGFELGSDGATPVSRIVVEPVNAETLDACMLGGRTFVTGFLAVRNERGAATGVSSASLVHEIDEGGVPIHSFPEPYAALRNPLVAETLGMARLACGETGEGAGMVWVAYALLGEVHAYDADGGLTWIARFSDLATPRFLASETTIRPDRSGQSVLEHLSHASHISSDLLAVQVTSRQLDREAGGPPLSYRTYLLDARSGEQVAAFQADHLVIGGGSGLAVLYRPAPFPQVSLVRGFQ